MGDPGEPFDKASKSRKGDRIAPKAGRFCLPFCFSLSIQPRIIKLRGHEIVMQRG